MEYTKQTLIDMIVEKFNEELKTTISDEQLRKDTCDALIKFINNNSMLVTKFAQNTNTENFTASRIHLRENSRVIGVIAAKDIEITDENFRAYECWRDMLKRCYSHGYKERKPTYAECTISDEWLVFSNFLKFYEEFHTPNSQLDKDILVKGNKTYSKETCCFVPSQINGLIVNIDTGKGYKWDESKNKYKAKLSINGKKKHIGYAKNEIDARFIYTTKKKEHINNIANEYLENGLITRKVFEALIDIANKLE